MEKFVRYKENARRPIWRTRYSKSLVSVDIDSQRVSETMDDKGVPTEVRFKDGGE